jgi:hypothetical protein
MKHVTYLETFHEHDSATREAKEWYSQLVRPVRWRRCSTLRSLFSRTLSSSKFCNRRHVSIRLEASHDTYVTGETNADKSHTGFEVPSSLTFSCTTNTMNGSKQGAGVQLAKVHM